MSLRITGMATGMDTDNTIKQLMKPYNMKVDKLKQDKQIMQWKQEMYREIMGDINTLKSTYLDKLKPDSCILLQANYSGFDVTTTSTSVSAVATTGAIPGDYTVSDVTVATKASKKGLEFATVLSSADNMSTLISGAVSFSVQSNANTKVDFSYDFSVGGVDENKTISQVMNDISSKTGLNATFSELGKNFTLSSNGTGVAESITTTTTSGNFLSTLFGAGSDGETFTGVDGHATIADPNGNSRTLPLTNNKLVIDGVSYNFIKDDAGSSTLSVTTNTQKAADKMKAFITKYNDIVGKIALKTKEKTQKGFPPLTDEQKIDMSAEDITNWENKAKQGLLKNDGLLTGILNGLRGSLFGAVGGAGGAQLSDSMGLGTYSFSEGLQGGKIKFDEEKFKTALQTNGTQLVNILTATSTTTPMYSRKIDAATRETRISEEGVFQRISDILEDYTSNIYTDINGRKSMLVEKAGIKGTASEITNLLYRDLKTKDTKIFDMERYLAIKENKYYMQFAKLETAMNKMNSQSSAMMQQLGGS